jgi:hypothetical protein
MALPSVIAIFAGAATSQSSAGMQYLIFGLLLICVILFQSNARYSRFLPSFRLKWFSGSNSSVTARKT